MRMSNEQLLSSIKEENKELKSKIDDAINTAEHAVLKIQETEETIISTYSKIKKISKEILKIVEKIEDYNAEKDDEKNEDSRDIFDKIVDARELVEE